MRKIPHTMATQHPDNAMPHRFTGRAFVTTQEEVDECFNAFSELHCEEFMWDWEGKHVDEGVTDKLIESHFEYFKEHQLGRDKFLTFRIPNIWMEKGYRVARAFANLIAANDFMEEMNLHTPPLFELILPMTTDAQKLFFIRSKYGEIVKAFEFVKEPGPSDVSIIPLIEEPSLMLETNVLLEEYVALCNKSAFKKFPVEYIRPFIARSDPALTCGLVPAVISAKAALSKIHEFSEKSSIPAFPILGVGSLPFRGHLSPDNISGFEEEYSGVRTVTVQSAFRADFPEKKVLDGVEKLNAGLKGKARVYSGDEIAKISKLNSLFSPIYQSTIENLEIINEIAKYVPARRERKLHIGLLGYSRKVGKLKLPRAITFTAAFYSLGVPPEFVGLGRGLKEAQKHHLLDFLLDTYLNLKSDLEFSGRFLNKENLNSLAKNSKDWAGVKEDVALAEELLSLEFGPKAHEDMIYRNITSNIRLLLEEKKDLSHELLKAAEIRRSLG
ncbi:MAG: phosphoenolpyruvate carboxylase [Candidatus Micrarchaeota archaeon]|mgnify:CR=1 FL=1